MLGLKIGVWLLISIGYWIGIVNFLLGKWLKVERFDCFVVYF